MTGAEVQATYFSPLMFFLYLFVIFVLMIGYYQWVWHKKADGFVKVIVREPDGSSTTEYAPKSGSSVTLTNPHTKLSRTWPFTDVCAIEMLYPGDGFVPKFLQKKIRTLIVDATDWEPLLNRGSYSEGVASPDVRELLRRLSEETSDDHIKNQLTTLVGNLKTAPTRELIGNPAVLGNIHTEKVSELAVTVARDIMNPLQEAIRKLKQQLSPTLVYVGLGLIAILVVYSVYLLSQMSNTEVGQLAEDISLIKKSLGVK